jgi:uncharacterized protein YaiE (UPF0345 family)
MEIWKDIEGFETLYEVSNYGNIKNKTTNKIRKLGVHSMGYWHVDLWIKGKQFNKHVHRLVANAFIPNPDNKPFVNHKDGNKQNNFVDNLEWCTPLENMKHARKNGYFDGKIPIGSKCFNSKLNEKTALEIYDLAINNIFKVTELAKMYNITHSVVSEIKSKKTWKHIHNGGALCKI